MSVLQKEEHDVSLTKRQRVEIQNVQFFIYKNEGKLLPSYHF